MKKKRTYKIPIITVKKINTNFFYITQDRSFDSFLAACITGGSLTCSCSGGSCGGGCCFLPRTKILMGDKSEKEIQDVKIGDFVLSYITENSTFVQRKVSKVLEHEDINGYIEINNKLEVTQEHPIWTKGQWKKAGELRLGDVLFQADDSEVIITNYEVKTGQNTVYNLEVGGVEHNYFAEGILVHNKLC